MTTDPTRNHALCEDCYGGMVDVGEARADPRRIDEEYRVPVSCCVCGTTTTSGLFLEAAADRFGECWKRPDGSRSILSFSRAHFNADLRPRDYHDWLLNPVYA